MLLLLKITSLIHYQTSMFKMLAKKNISNSITDSLIEGILEAWCACGVVLVAEKSELGGARWRSCKGGSGFLSECGSDYGSNIEKDITVVVYDGFSAVMEECDEMVLVALEKREIMMELLSGFHVVLYMF